MSYWVLVPFLLTDLFLVVLYLAERERSREAEEALDATTRLRNLERHENSKVIAALLAELDEWRAMVVRMADGEKA